MATSDGSVVIKVIADEKQAKELLITLGNIERTGKQVNNSFGKNNTNPFKKPTGGAKDMLKAILGSKGIVMAMGMVKDSVGSAISRFDTMKQYPRMMEKLGFSTEQSERSIRKLSTGIEGLPTRLDEVVGTAQQLTGITGDINKATDLTLALNNAFLSSGSSAGDASRGLVQFTQMLSSGKVDMQSWRTLNETMNLGLIKVAESFGFAGASAKNDLYAALRDGRITFNQFSDKLIEINKQTGGFAETAKEGSRGLATSWQNIKTAVVNGIAGIITILDDNMKKVTGEDIASGLDVLKVIIKGFFTGVQSSIKAVLPILNGLYQVLNTLIRVGIRLQPVLIGLLYGFVAFKAITGISLLIGAFSSGLMTIQIYALYAVDGLKALWALMLANPLVAVAAGITAVVAGIIAFASKTSEETKKLLEEMDNAKKETKTLTDSVKENADNWKKQAESLDENRKSMRTLADEIDTLNKVEGRSASQTKDLKDKVKELNSYLGDEVVLYDEKTKSINMSTEAMQAYIDVASSEEKLTAIREKNNALQKEKMDIDIQSKANAELLAQAEKERDEANFLQKGKIQKKIDELKESENTLAEARNLNAEQFKIVEQQKNEVLKESAEAEQRLTEQIKTRGLQMQDLSESERQVVEDMKSRYKSIEEAATTMFDKINTDSKLSTEQMLENLEHNVQAVDEWATNLQTLADRGVNQGMLEQLRAMGPQGAGYVAELATMSDTELQKFNELFKKAGENAPPNLAKSMGKTGEVVIPEGVGNLITKAEQTLTDKFKAVDWAKYGQEVPNGVTKGMNDKQGEVKNSSQNLAKGAKEAFTSELGINSPSRVFTDYGKNIDEGLANGIKDGANLVTQSLKILTDNLSKVADTDFNSFREKADTTFKDFSNMTKTNLDNAVNNTSSGLNNMLNAFKTKLTVILNTSKDMMKSIVSSTEIKGKLQYTGAMAGNGFMWGLESRRGAILWTAQSIANQVAYTMRRALDIHSPSRVLKKIGIQSGEGYEVGLDEKIKDIKSKANLLAESAVPKAKDFNLFDKSMEYVKSSTINNNDYKNTTTNKTVFNVDKIVWQGKEDIRKTMEEMGWIAGQERWRLETT